MKVLQINAVYGYKSTGIIVKDIDKTLQINGHESYIAYQKCSTRPNNGYKIGNIIDCKTHGLLTRIIGKQAYFSILSTKRLLQYIDIIKPDIIHLHNLHSNYINLNMLLKYLEYENIKTIITLHDCWFFTGKCFHYSVIGCKKWQKHCENCPKLKDDVPSWLLDQTAVVFHDKEKYLSAIYDLVIVGVSDWISNEAAKSFLKGKRIITIHNGVDLDIFKPTESDIKMKLGVENKFVILGTANKWLDKINKNTFHYVTNQLAEDEVMLLIGCSKEQMGKLPDRVIGIEYINSREELAQIYSTADVYVNVTWEDSLPTVNIESLCCGTPVITFDSGGSPEIINQDTGIVVEQGDYKSLFNAIREVKLKGKEYYKLRCIEHGVKNFNKNDRYLDYIQLYQYIVNK